VTSGPGTPFAIPGPGPVPVRIRIETPGDEPGVRYVNRAAFPGPEEADIVDAIRADAPEGWHSLVAVGAPDSAADGIVVGHLLLSPCRVEGPDGGTVATVLAIGPVAVLPELQFRGVGSALMAAAVSLAVARGVPALVLLGHPSYYPRFGFGSACSVGLEPPAAAWPDSAWMARLLPAWTDAMRGTVRYHVAFEPLA
jgi:putative acetyltransferase